MPKLQHSKPGTKTEVFTLSVPRSIVRAKEWVKGDVIDFFLDPRTGEVYLKKTTTAQPTP